MAKKYRKHLAEILIEVGMIDPIVMGSMLSEHRETQKPLVSILINHGLTTMKLLSYVMEQEYEFKHIDMERFVVPSKISHIFDKLHEDAEKGLPIELFPIPKKDFDMKRWVVENTGDDDIHIKQHKSITLTIVTEDDFYNYVTDSRKLCMMCMNPLIIKNANSCYRLKKLTDNKAKSVNIPN